VRLHRGQADDQALGDLGVRQPAGDEQEHLARQGDRRHAVARLADHLQVGDGVHEQPLDASRLQCGRPAADEREAGTSRSVTERGTP